MKKLNFIMGLVLVLFASLFVASCNNDDEESLEQEFAHVLDNHGVAYSFSDNGNCFGDGGGIGQADFNKMFIGHGWKHYATWEIDKNGKRQSGEYYSNMIGVTPENYYFDSDTKLTTYFNSDADGGAVQLCRRPAGRRGRPLCRPGHLAYRHVAEFLERPPAERTVQHPAVAARGREAVRAGQRCRPAGCPALRWSHLL